MPYFERVPWKETTGASEQRTPRGADKPDSFPELVQSILSSEAGHRHALDGPFRCADTVAPGNRGSLVLNVSADDSGGSLALDLSPCDLKARSGAVIASNMMQIVPTNLTIPPGESRTFEVVVLVPGSTSPGLYSGRVTGTGPEPIGFIVEIDVAGEPAT